ncbi:MAG TPA: thiamine-phosphate kinase [Actinomycetota bacterium]|nr:thiamine-phosphate kinase [Actinomycetota bacterium]
MNGRSGTLAELGENALLALIRDRIGAAPHGELWSGDDAAYVATGNGLLITTDLLVEGVDLDLAYTSPADLGWKLVAVNVSDIAAMGGTPRHAVAGLVLRPDMETRFVEDLLDGMLDACRTWSVSLVGGDISGGQEVMASLTLTGDVEGAPVTRSGARPGDGVFVTGALGGSAAGLLALRHGLGRDDAACAPAVERHLRPQPPAAAGPALQDVPVSAMIDVSDGLLLDLTRLLDASGVGCRITRADVPIDPVVGPVLDRLPDPVDGSGLALTGGEDFELLFTVPAELSAEATAAVGVAGTGARRIGTIVEGTRTIDGAVLDESEGLGWDHLLNR